MNTSDVGTSPELVEHPPFEDLLIQLSARFVNLPSDEVDGAIEAAQRRICEGLNLDRSTVWQRPTEEPTELRLTHTYQRPDAPPVPAYGDGRTLFPWAVERINGGETLVIDRLSDLPPEAACDRESWQRAGTKSTVVIPLSIGGVALGAISFASVRAPRHWPPEHMRRLELFAQVIGNAIARSLSDRALRDSEERLRLAADAAGAGLWVMALDTSRVWATSKTRELFRFAPDEALDVGRFLEAIHPEDRATVRARVEQAVATRTQLNAEYRVVHPGGLVRWIASRGSLRRSGSADPERFMGISVDITDRKQAEATLAQRNHYIETVLEQAPIGFAVHTIDDQVGRFVSARFEEIYAVPRGTITSHTDFFDKVWPNAPEIREQIRARVLADIASGDVGRMRWENVPLLLASGETRYITATNIPLFEQNLMVSTVQDVTDRVRAERGHRRLYPRAGRGAVPDHRAVAPGGHPRPSSPERGFPVSRARRRLGAARGNRPGAVRDQGTDEETHQLGQRDRC